MPPPGNPSWPSSAASAIECPERLLAVFRALQGPTRGQQRALSDQRFRQRNDRLGWNAGQRRGPRGRLRYGRRRARRRRPRSVRRPCSSGRERRGRPRRVRAPRARARGSTPCRSSDESAARSRRTPPTPSSRIGEMLVKAMSLARASAAWSAKPCKPAPPEATFQFFDGKPPKATKRSVCAKISRHSVTLPVTRVDVAEHVRQQHHRRAETIIRRLQRRAADRPQEAVQQRARVVQAGPRSPSRTNRRRSPGCRTVRERARARRR